MALGLSQERLAQRLHVDRTTVGRWEQGTSTPQPWHRRPLANALRVTLDALGRPEAALAIYDEVSPSTFVGERQHGSFVIIHAQALAHAGHLDEGVRVAVDGLDMARSYQSARHVSRVQRMYDRLVRTWSPSEPALVALGDALAA